MLLALADALSCDAGPVHAIHSTLAEHVGLQANYLLTHSVNSFLVSPQERDRVTDLVSQLGLGFALHVVSKAAGNTIRYVIRLSMHAERCISMCCLPSLALLRLRALIEAQTTNVIAIKLFHTLVLWIVAAQPTIFVLSRYVPVFVL